MLVDAIEYGEVFKEYMPLQRYPLESSVGYRLDPTHRDEQKPSESQTHVHIAEHTIYTEYAAV